LPEVRAFIDVLQAPAERIPELDSGLEIDGEVAEEPAPIATTSPASMTELPLTALQAEDSTPGPGRTVTSALSEPPGSAMESAAPDPELPETVPPAPPESLLATTRSTAFDDEGIEPRTTPDARRGTMLGTAHKGFRSAVAEILRPVRVVVGVSLVVLGVAFIAFSRHESTGDESVASSPRRSPTAALTTPPAELITESAAAPAPPATDGSAEATSPTALAPVAPSQPTRECFADVRSMPDEAEIVLGQNVIGTTPQRVALPCGQPVDLVLRKQRLAQATRTVLPTPEGTVVQIELAKQAFLIKVSSTPPGATVTFNGKSLGVTPTIVKLPAFETSTLNIGKDGYQTEAEKVAPKGTGVAIHTTLKKLEGKDRRMAKDLGSASPAPGSTP
jgi:hypothetical protein